MKKVNYMKSFSWGILASLAILLASCYPEQDKDLEDYDIVVTMKNDSTFSNEEGQNKIKTYFLADTVVHVADSIKSELDPDFPRDYDQKILAAVTQNLEEIGYERITDTTDISNSPDVLISVSALAIRNTVIYSYYPGYWWGGGYWGDFWWGYPGYYPVYPWYPPYYSGYSYNKGTIFIDMVSYDDTAADDEKLVSQWSGILNGLLYEGNVPTDERIDENIDKVFDKSPYLQYVQ